MYKFFLYNEAVYSNGANNYKRQHTIMHYIAYTSISRNSSPFLTKYVFPIEKSYCFFLQSCKRVVVFTAVNICRLSHIWNESKISKCYLFYAI